MSFLLNAVTVLSGSGTYSVPPGVTALLVRMVGAGGGGGGATSGLAVNARGGGGSGGGYVEKFLTGLSASYAFSVGGGGSGGPNSGTNGLDGGATTFGALTANGGLGGNSSSVTADAGTPGRAGAAAGSGGNLNAQGEVSGYGYKNSGRMGSGEGASSPFGAGGKSVITNSAGSVALGFGSGGGGAISQNNSQAGGNGGNGTIIIFEFVSKAAAGGSYVVQFLNGQYQVMTIDLVPPAELTYVKFHDQPWPLVTLIRASDGTPSPGTIQGLIEDFGHQRRVTVV